MVTFLVGLLNAMLQKLLNQIPFCMKLMIQKFGLNISLSLWDLLILILLNQLSGEISSVLKTFVVVNSTGKIYYDNIKRVADSLTH